jgi:hypothetical protein
VSFIHRFSSALNANLRFHGYVIEGLFRTAAEDYAFTRSK